jgi:hypothetical protein
MDYPVEHPGAWKSLETVSVMDRAMAVLRTLRHRRRARRYSRPALSAVNVVSAPLGQTEPVLICVTKDAAKYLPSLLRHYRHLGVKRFGFVDDRSRDDTRAILLAQDDLDLFESDIDFKSANGGNIWRDMLVEHYGRNRWFLSVDSDEYLVYPGYENRPLASFIDDLERRKLKRAHAAMIDIYPASPLGAPRAATALDAPPTATSPLYDGSNYTIGHEMFGTAVRGGPRQRLYGVEMRMSKFPLIYADKATQFTGGSHHGPLPLTRNFGPVHAVLLHHKFPAGAVEDFREIARRGTHSGKSAFYKTIVARSDFSDEADLRYAHSRAFEGSHKLVQEGFMQDLRTAG